MTIVNDAEIIIPSNPADREELFKVIKEISNSKTRAEAETDYQKEAISALEEKFAIKAKYIRRMAADYHKDQFDEKASEHDQYAELYEAIVKQLTGAKEGATLNKM